MNWTLISATNNRQVLNTSLLGSPEAAQANELLLQEGYSSAACAYNAAIDKARYDILVFAHQDVYLPPGWTARLQETLEWFGENDPQWAVAGVWGVARTGKRNGNVYCTGLGKHLGGDFPHPVEVRTVDELLLVVRKSAGIRFDEKMPGYHMYGTDICLEAQHRGLKCYAISTFCIHNTNGYGMLPWEFWKCYLLMRRKWKKVLPVMTPCAEITFSCWSEIRSNLALAKDILLRKHQPGKRVADPGQLYEQLTRKTVSLSANDPSR